jgi:hypothetical protein
VSFPECTGAKEDKPLSPAKQGRVRQKLQPGGNLDAAKDTGYSSHLLAFASTLVSFAIGRDNPCSQHL